MSIRVSVLIFCLAAATRLQAATPPAKVIPPDWLPALAPSIQSALDNLKEAESQSQMNLLSREVADMTDAQLFITYVRLYQRLPVSDRAELLDEQTKWLAKRPKVAREGVQSKGGSLAPLEANNTELTYTEKRLAELRARLKALGDQDDTAARRASAVEDEATPKKKKKKTTASDTDGDTPKAKPKVRSKPKPKPSDDDE